MASNAAVPALSEADSAWQFHAGKSRRIAVMRCGPWRNRYRVIVDQEVGLAVS